MALDRNIRSGFELSLAHVAARESESTHPARARRLVRRSSAGARAGQPLGGQREQGNLSVASGELAKPELLMLAGECAIKNARFEMAAESVRTFFLMDPPRDQFYCRALFCQALVESEIARPP